MHSCFLLFLQILLACMNCSFLLLLQVHWVLLWTFHEFLVTNLVCILDVQCAFYLFNQKLFNKVECNGPWWGLLFSTMSFSYSYKSCERYNFFPSSKLLFLWNLGSKLDVGSCEILFLSSCVNGVCYFHLWVSPILQLLWNIWFSSFISKLLFLLDLGNKLFVNSYEILFVNFYVCKVCYFHLSISPKPASLVTGMVFFL
jgi:hypothetical protein